MIESYEKARRRAHADPRVKRPNPHLPRCEGKGVTPEKSGASN